LARRLRRRVSEENEPMMNETMCLQILLLTALTAASSLVPLCFL